MSSGIAEIPPLGPVMVIRARNSSCSEMQYRNQVEFAVGHGIAVHAELDQNDPRHALAVETRVIPSRDVRATELINAPGLGSLERDMKALSELDTAGLVDALSALPDAYESWIEKQQERADRGELNGHETAASTALDRCRRALGRIREGIAVIGDDPQAAAAFQFANRAMWLQRIHSEYAIRRRRGEDVSVEDFDRPEQRSWYPFQLAYILLTVPGLADPTDRGRIDPTSAVADLLWFPTGGGKTEAYLGVAAFAMGLRRLRGTWQTWTAASESR